MGVTAIGTIGVGVGAAAIGMCLGRSIWQLVARRSERQVEEIATALVTATGEITEG